MVTSLVIDGVRGTSAQFLRLACAFPKLTDLEYRECVGAVEDAPEADCVADAFASLAFMGPPPLTSLSLVRSSFSLPLDVLFPSGTEVRLQSLGFEPNKASEYAEWFSLIKRAGSNLEQLVVEFMRLAPGKCHKSF